MRSALIRTAVVAAAAVALVGAAVFAPLALRTLGAFRVQRVEVIGAHHLAARAAVDASGITRASNVFDDPLPWIDALSAHPLVSSARIERRLPGTIVLHIEEAVPVALARTPELRAIAANGRILPMDPAAADIDLPVLAVTTRVSADGRAVDAATLDIVRFLAMVAQTEPGLLGWISEVGSHGDAIRLVLRTATDAEVLVSARPAPERLRELHITLGELATVPAVRPAGTSGRAVEPDLAHVKRIDVRFHDQIVVSLHQGKS